MISKFSDFINEGLIQSLSTDNAFDILKKNLSPDIYILNYGRWCGLKLSVNPKNKKMKKGVLTHLDKIEQILKQIGWYIRDKNYKEFNYKREIIIEPKFDIKILKKDIPLVLYHVTDEKYVEKIKKKGLLPRSHSKLTYHPERVYLCTSGSMDYLANEFYKNYGMEPVILSIDMEKLNIDLYMDRNMQTAFYTTDSIPPTSIKGIIDWIKN